MNRVALHVGQLLQPVPGGIGTYVRALTATLPTAGVDLQTFASGPRPDDLTVPYTDLGFPSGALRYELWLRTRGPRIPVAADVVHGPSLAVPPARTRTGPAALVVTVHDVAFLRYPQHFTKRGVAFHRRGLEIARRRADIVITPSEFTREELEREGFDPERVVAIPHGMVVPAAPDPVSTQATLNRLHIDGPFILGVGTIEPRKGFAIVAAAMERFTDTDLTFIIAGPPGWNEVSGLERANVRRLGRVDAATLDALYRSARACVVPSEYEGFGLPALEAMARGCPVLVSDTSSLPEVVGAAGIRVSSGDVAAWGNAIAAMVDDDAARAASGHAGLARAAEFTWEQAGLAHAAAYARAREIAS